MSKVSAGILLYKLTDAGMKILAVHPGGPYNQNKDLGAWSLPKGEVSEGEDLLVCAIRELKEETGLTVSGNGIELGSVKQKGGKTVYAWAYEYKGSEIFEYKSNTFKMEYPYKSGKYAEYPEVDKAEFFSVEDAKIKLNPAQAEFIDILIEKLYPSK